MILTEATLKHTESEIKKLTLGDTMRHFNYVKALFETRDFLQKRGPQMSAEACPSCGRDHENCGGDYDQRD